METKGQAMFVGLCGRSGAGKGYVSKLFAAEGIPSIDTDLVYRELTGPTDAAALTACMKELVSFFGESVKKADNSLNRAVLRTLVFGEENRDNLKKLNEITHRHILARTEEIASDLFASGYPIILIDAPLLFESGFDARCDAVICVTAPEALLLSRIMERDGLDEASALLRLRSQKSREELEARAQYVIENDVDKPELISRVHCVAENLRKRLRHEDC